MTHTVIIPHRGRPMNLSLCVGSLYRSAEACGVKDWRAIVVGDKQTDDPFNKSKALNEGLDRVPDGVVTILDADAIVGRRFLDAANVLEDQGIRRVCYRVIPLPDVVSRMLLGIRNQRARDDHLEDLRRAWDTPGLFKPAFEAYRFPDRDRFELNQQPWGNSQFTMRRRDLDGLRFDEDQIGHGWEDVDFNRQVYARFGASYRGRIFTDADHAMFHLTGPREVKWGDERTLLDNLERYRQKWPATCAEMEKLTGCPWGIPEHAIREVPNGR